MGNYTFMGLMKTSIIMPVLFGLSIIMLAVAFERILYHLKHGSAPGKLVNSIKSLIAAGDLKKEQIIQLCSNFSGLLADSIKHITIAASQTTELGDKVLKIKRQEARALLGMRVELFGTLSFIAPLLGLLGTVMGIMRSFHDLSVSGSGGPSIVAAGISEALITTIAGIAVAVTAAVLNNYFIIRIKKVAGLIDILGQEIIVSLNSKQEA